MQIEIVSDVICPWCFVGRRRLATALSALRLSHPALTFSVVWRPFFLDGSLPSTGVNKLERYISKFGAARVSAMIPAMKATGEAEGIAFSFGGKVSNTLDAHRLLSWALAQGGPELQDAVSARLMRLYFEEEGDIGDRAALAAAAAEAGASAADAAAMLASAALTEEVQAEAREVRHRFGITGVPFFIVNGGAAVLAGAQDPRELERVILQAALAQGR